jgi:hypothetical protein
MTRTKFVEIPSAELNKKYAISITFTTSGNTDKFTLKL